MEVEIKCLTFSDNVFEVAFWNEICLTFVQISLKFVSTSPIHKTPSLVQMRGDKPLSEPMMAKFTDAYVRHSASMSEKEISFLYILSESANPSGAHFTSMA